jgi:hypothetical protein
VSRDASGAGFGPPGAPALWLAASGKSKPGVHLAFAAADRAGVDRFHAKGLAPAVAITASPGSDRTTDRTTTLRS